MAKIRDYAITIETVATASSVLEMPDHVTGDLLLICFNKDTSGGLPTTPSGWSIVGAAFNSTGSGHITYGKRAASAAETVTLSYTLETSVTVVISIKNCFGSTVADAVSNTAQAGADDATLPIDGGTFTPSYNNSLIISHLGADALFGATTLPGWVHLVNSDDGVDTISGSYTYQKTAASITHPGYWAAAADDSRWNIIAIRDDGNETEVDPYVDRATTPATLISPLVFSATPDKGTWELTTNDIVSIATNDGTKILTQLDAVVAADSGYNPFRAATRVIAASSKTVLYASQNRRTTNDDMTVGAGVLFGTFRPQLPRDYLDMGKAVKGGTLLGIADASNNYQFWCIAGQLSKTTDPSSRQNYAIEVNTSDTDYARSTTLPTLSAINDIYFAGSGYYGACSVEWSELWLLNKTVVAGGTTANPLDFLEIEFAVNRGSGNIPLVVRNGSSATFWTAIQFGGSDPIHVACNLNVFQYPRKSDILDYLDFHVSNNKMGFEFYGLSGDLLDFANSVFTSDSPYYWRFNASHNAGATLNFSGTTVVGATVTLQATSDLDGTDFINCSTFTQNGATLTNCAFTNTKVSASSTADAVLISSSSFTKTTGTQHGIEISGTAANCTLSNLTFTGYASSNGSTGNEAIYVNISSGSMTISIDGGSTPSIRTAGATVTVENSVNLIITVLDSSTNPVPTAQVAIYRVSDDVELMNEDTQTVTTGAFVVGIKYTIVNVGDTDFTLIGATSNTVGIGFIATGVGGGTTGTASNGVATQSFNYTTNTPVYVRIRKSSTGGTKYIPTSTTGTITSSGYSLTVTLPSDEYA